MERQTKKRLLRSYTRLLTRIKTLHDDYEVTYTNATKMSPSMSGMPSGNVRENKLEKGAEKLAELDERIKKAEAKKAFIESEIRKLKPHQRALIAAVDIQLRPIPAVAREMGVSEKAIRKARNRIIDKMFLQV